MKITIAGCGKIGRSIIRSLIREKHQIAVIDKDPAVINGVLDNYDVLGVCGSCTDMTTLREVSAGSSDLFIAVTGNDETNMLACFLANRMGAANTAARVNDHDIRTNDPEFLKSQLGLSMIINPNLITAQVIYNMIKFPSSIRSGYFTRRHFEMVELSVKQNSALDGETLYRLREKTGINFLICCVLRDGKTHIPNGDFMLQAGDVIGLLAASDDMLKLLRKTRILQKKTRNVLIIGAGKTSVHLAEILTKNGNTVKMIEKSEARCSEISSVLPYSVNLINGDGSDLSVLSDEHIERADAFVSLTGIDEENILSSYHAMDRKVPKVITKVNQEGFADISEKMGLETIVSPAAIIADTVKQYARALQNSRGSRIETIYTLMNGSVEALEFIVSEDFSRADVQLKDLKLKSGVLIAGIIRDNRTIIPNGSDVIKKNDRVIVIAAERQLCDLNDILL